MNKKKLQKWNFTLAAMGGLIGMLLGTVFTKGLDWSAILGAFTAFAIIFLINFFYVRSKSDKTPEVDERTILNMRKYYAIIANVFLGILFLSLAAVTYMGYEQISLSYLWIFIISYMLISGVGALIVNNR
ncbi:hypothetical protein [Planomicrobium sp. YIM 101495]|uniref:hypothetical protein n=1 Tax=Planomicrobium sp. YIM 101495 TaxID=2665160 RepID=UPI0012B9FDB9|nr:hypothetical protein [Planomicrobium sp. YIM 101495]MTD30690.1 hypothetical protein [Planomicrobium sp. YIM 101495]